MAKHGEVRERIAEVAGILMRRGAATPHTIRGCSTKEMAEIEAEVGRKLPLAYREFLARMGRGAGEFYVGSNVFYPDVLGVTEAAHRLVTEDEAGLVLPDDAIVFIMHQGYQFVFMRADEGEDPSVHYYMERSGEFVKKADQLSQFLINVAHDEW